MTVTLDIITQAHRESNLIAITATLTDAQQTEGLKKLSTLVSSVLGYEVGEGYRDWLVGTDQDNLSWDSSRWAHPIPNSRLLVTATDDQTIYMPRHPDNGARIQLVDCAVAGARTITLDGSGFLIDGAATFSTNTAGFDIEWLWRADIGQWKRLNSLLIDSDMPFPDRYDSFFETMLAMRLNPRYGRTMDPQSAAVLQRASTQMRAAYRQRVATPAPLGVNRPSRQVGQPWRNCFRPGRNGWQA